MGKTKDKRQEYEAANNILILIPFNLRENYETKSRRVQGSGEKGQCKHPFRIGHRTTTDGPNIC